MACLDIALPVGLAHSIAMLRASLSRHFRLALVVLLGLFVSACDQIASLATPLSGPTHRYVLSVDEERLAERFGEDADQTNWIEESLPILDQRLSSLGLIVHDSKLDSGRLQVDLSGEGHKEAVETAIGRNLELEIRPVDGTASREDLLQRIAPPGSELVEMADGTGVLAVERLGGIKGHDVVRATSGLDPATGEPTLIVTLNERAAKKFGRLTQRIVGKQIAIIVDGQVVSAPIVFEPVLGGSVQISGNFDEATSTEMAALLSSGALPTPFRIEQVIVLGQADG